MAENGGRGPRVASLMFQLQSTHFRSVCRTRTSMTMLSADAAAGSQLPARVQAYIEALVQTCAQDRVPLVSVVLFGSAAKGGFSGDVSDVDLILVVADDTSRVNRRRLGEVVARLEAVHGLEVQP